MRLLLVAVLMVSAGCRAQSNESPQEAGQGAGQEVGHKAGQEVDMQKKEPIPSGRPTPVCADLACLEQRDGQTLRVSGTLRCPKEQAFARNKLELGDGTFVVLPPASKVAELSADNDGKPMTVDGTVFIKEIPASYEIVGRTPDPYLLDVTRVELQ